MILIGERALDLVMILAITLVILAIGYLSLILALALRQRSSSAVRRWPLPQELDLAVDPGFHVILLMPCLNEEKVLRASLERITELPHPRLQALIVDDGSDDGTSAVVGSFGDPRIHLLRRDLPQARQGKGQALNAGYRHIMAGRVVPADELDPERTVVVVLDADGRLDQHALHTVLPGFEDPRLGGTQIGVRINNRRSNLLARMQDLEFVMYTEVFQRGRRHLGSVGLGGNGQFVRLSALESLAPQPWTDSLCEDLDLGVRLGVQGWSLDFCPRAAVHQQGLEDLPRWIRQRTRWFQGHLQAWSLIPAVLDRLPGRARADLFYHLTTPFLTLTSSLFTLAFISWILVLGIQAVTGDLGFSWVWVTAYAFAFVPMTLLAMIYRRLERTTDSFGLLRGALCAHLYVGYAALWYIAGWRAVWNVLRGRRAWSKTERVDEDHSASEENLLTVAADRAWDDPSPRSGTDPTAQSPTPAEETP